MLASDRQPAAKEAQEIWLQARFFVRVLHLTLGFYWEVVLVGIGLGAQTSTEKRDKESYQEENRIGQYEKFSMTEMNKDNFFQNYKFLEWKAIASYLLTFVLVVLPFYNWFYRNFVNFLHVGMLLISVLIVLFTIFRHLLKKEFKRALISLLFGAIIFCAGLFAHDWRYTVTDQIIKANYCDLSRPIESEYILGGINEMWSADFPGRTGAFENSSHCLTVSCVEEFYYCHNAKMEVYR